MPVVWTKHKCVNAEVCKLEEHLSISVFYPTKVGGDYEINIMGNKTSERAESIEAAKVRALDLARVKLEKALAYIS